MKKNQRKRELHPNANRDDYIRKLELHPDFTKHYIRFKGKQINIGFNILAGKCSECGSTKQTVLHHDKYDWNNIIKYTRELCIRCHTIFHRTKLIIPEINKP